MFLDKIKEIHVEPTTVCQAECPMCPRTVQGYHLGRVLNQFLTLDEFQRKIQPIVIDLEKVLFCGTLGEPAACGDLLSMIDWVLASSPECVIGMNTNGGIRDASWWAELANKTKHNMRSYVVFSIDGLEDTNHIYRRRVDWQRVISNAQAFIEAGGNAHWDMLVFKHNEHQVDAAKDLAKQMGFRFFRTKVTSRFEPGDGFEPPSGHVQSFFPLPLSCMAKETSSLYLSAAGLWYPCCYTHMSDETKFDVEWGKPIMDINDRHEAWADLFNPIKKICNRACATTHNRGQWTGEWQLDV